MEEGTCTTCGKRELLIKGSEVSLFTRHNVLASARLCLDCVDLHSEGLMDGLDERD